MQIVATIHKGHKIATNGQTFEVLGNMSLRGRYFYQVRDLANRKVFSLSREDVLEAQREGTATVIA